MTALASAGYLVVAPNHRDATCNGGDARWIDRPEQSFGKPETWDETSFRDRADDIVHLVAALKAGPEWRNRVDWQRFGLIGHSLGGYTVLGLDGAWPSWKLDGVKAVLALSPYVQPFLVRRTLAGLAAPVMYQGGTLDFGITPALHKAMGAYDLSPTPKYYVELKGAGHFAWTDSRGTFHDPIVAYSPAFLDLCVRGSPASPLLTRATSAVPSSTTPPEPQENPCTRARVAMSAKSLPYPVSRTVEVMPLRLPPREGLTEIARGPRGCAAVRRSAPGEG